MMRRAQPPNLQTSRAVRFSTLVRGAVVLSVVAVMVGAVAAPARGVPANGWTYTLLLLLGVILYAIAHWGGRRNDGLMLLLVVSAVLLYVLSALLLLLEAESVVEFRRFGQPAVAEVNRTLLLALISVASLGAGLWAGRPESSLRESTDWARRALPVSFYRGRRFFLLTGGAGLLVALALTAVLDVRVSGVAAGPLAWVANLVDRDFFALLLIALFVYAGRRMLRWERQLAIVILSLYIAVTLTQGSRGGLLVLVLSWSLHESPREGDFRFEQRQVVAVGVVIVLTSVVIWPLATGIRLAKIANLPLNSATVTRMIGIAQDLPGSNGNAALRLILPILHRQGRMPQAVAVTNRWVPNADQRIPARGILLNSVAGLVPRVSVDQADPSLGRGYSIHFLGMAEDRIHGAEWSPVAVVMLFAPPWMAVAIWFLWGFSIQRLYTLLRRAKPSGYILVMRAIFLYLLGFQAFSSATFDVLYTPLHPLVCTGSCGNGNVHSAGDIIRPGETAD